MNYIERFKNYKKMKKDLSYIKSLDTYLLTDLYTEVITELYNREDFNDINDMLITYKVIKNKLLALNVIEDKYILRSEYNVRDN